MNDPEKWIETLRLATHPEGGHYRETYRSDEILEKDALPGRFGGDRSFCTAIYFLLRSNEFSAFHRIKQDEVWHFYDGSSLIVHIIDEKGEYSETKVGRDLSEGAFPQAVVKAGCFFAASVNDLHSYSLVGCTVAPGFDFDDFEMPARNELCQRFPQHRQIIETLTY
jgi:predicted cupin superfamily sugar epimerase